MANGGRVPPDLNRQEEQDPAENILANLIVQQFLAQQFQSQEIQPDATRVAGSQQVQPRPGEAGIRPRQHSDDIARLIQGVMSIVNPEQATPREGQGSIENLLKNIIEGVDPTLGIATGQAGLRPEDPSFGLQMAAGAFTGGSLVKLLRAGGRRAMEAGGRIMARNLDPAAAARASDEATGAILDQIGIGGRRAAGVEADQIRSQIFRDILERRGPDPFGDVAAARAKSIEGVGELAARRSVR